MKYEGVLTKMKTENGSPIQYYLVFENDFLNVNQLLNKKVQISFIKVSVSQLWTGEEDLSSGFLLRLLF